jgi:4-diphosphocytidyl-2-C-methyl-D-erythritol kinase
LPAAPARAASSLAIRYSPSFAVLIRVHQPLTESLRPYPDTEDLGRGAFALSAPAKINLALRVLGRRTDGFHELNTLFQEISLADRLEFHPADSFSLQIQGADLDSGPKNLICQAADHLSRIAGLSPTGRILLQKQIPIGGGLGGGSSDGAVTLLGLSRLWGLNWPVSRLHPIAAELGSDCAFFLYGGLALGKGRGEVLELLADGDEAHVVLITPPYPISTAAVFAEGRFPALPLTDDEKSAILGFYPQSTYPPLLARGNSVNDLENIVLKKFPELYAVKRALLELGANVSMLSGSGSTIFALFGERDRAEHAALQFGPPFKARICRTVKRPRTV